MKIKGSQAEQLTSKITNVSDARRDLYKRIYRYKDFIYVNGKRQDVIMMLMWCWKKKYLSRPLEKENWIRTEFLFNDHDNPEMFSQKDFNDVPF